VALSSFFLFYVFTSGSLILVGLVKLYGLNPVLWNISLFLCVESRPFESFFGDSEILPGPFLRTDRIFMLGLYPPGILRLRPSRQYAFLRRAYDFSYPIV